jgi:hypothetical protein
MKEKIFLTGDIEVDTNRDKYEETTDCEDCIYHKRDGHICLKDNSELNSAVGCYGGWRKKEGKNE